MVLFVILSEAKDLSFAPSKESQKGPALVLTAN